MRTQDFFEIGGSKKTSSQMASKWPSVAILDQNVAMGFFEGPERAFELDADMVGLRVWKTRLRSSSARLRI